MSVCFVHWAIRGSEWRRATVLAAFDVTVTPLFHAQRLAAILRSELRGSTLVYVQRGHRPQYAIVRGVSDPAGLRAGHIAPIAWIRYDTHRKRYAPCDITADRAEVLRALNLFNTEMKNDILSVRELGTLTSLQFARIVPMIPARRNGGLFLAAPMTVERYKCLRGIERALNTQPGHSFVLNILRGSNVDNARAAWRIVHESASIAFSYVYQLNEHPRRTARYIAYRRKVKQRVKMLLPVWAAVREYIEPWRTRIDGDIEQTANIVAQIECAMKKA